MPRLKGLGGQRKTTFFTSATSGQQEAGTKRPAPRWENGEEYYKWLHSPIATIVAIRQGRGMFQNLRSHTVVSAGSFLFFLTKQMFL